LPTAPGWPGSPAGSRSGPCRARPKKTTPCSVSAVSFDAPACLSRHTPGGGVRYSPAPPDPGRHARQAFGSSHMASRREQEIDHILRRAGFGATQEEVDSYARLAFGGPTFALGRLLSYKQIPDDVDEKIGKPGYVAITATGEFLPTANIAHARQRWLFRMVHSDRPLQEKMALFWHNHFVTAYTKIQGDFGATEATRMLAAKPKEDPGGVKGQLELFREYALGNFRDLLVAVAQDPAMLVWLDGRTNFRGQPPENFARGVGGP